MAVHSKPLNRYNYPLTYDIQRNPIVPMWTTAIAICKIARVRGGCATVYLSLYFFAFSIRLFARRRNTSSLFSGELITQICSAICIFKFVVSLGRNVINILCILAQSITHVQGDRIYIFFCVVIKLNYNAI